MRKKTAIYLGWLAVSISVELEAILKEVFELRFVHYCRPKEKIDVKHLSELNVDFLFNFGPVILTQTLLNSVGIAAVNFHTGPPKWPGRGSCSFALFKGDAEFGVTAHLMTDQIDGGPIIKVVRFPILGNESCESLHERTLAKIPDLVRQVVRDLQASDWKPKCMPEQWERKALQQKDLMALMEVKEGESEEIVLRKVKAFAHSTKPGPFMVKENKRYWYLKDKWLLEEELSSYEG